MPFLPCCYRRLGDGNKNTKDEFPNEVDNQCQMNGINGEDEDEDEDEDEEKDENEDEEEDPDEEELFEDEQIPWSADDWDEPLTLPVFPGPHPTGGDQSVSGIELQQVARASTSKGKSVTSGAQDLDDNEYNNIDGEGGWDWGTYSPQAGPAKKI